MAKILCIDTATGPCSVAVAIDGKAVAGRLVEEAYRHSEKLNALIGECLTETAMEFKDLDAVALSSGPGSYTSLRVGAATAKAICFALDIPLISIGTLFALAGKMRETAPAEFYIPMIDARRMEVFTGVYDEKLNEVGGPVSMILDTTSYETLKDRRVVLGGDGSGKFKAFGTPPRWEFSEIVCSAENLTAPAEVYYKKKLFVSLFNFTPLYLKKPNITQSKREPF